MSETEVLTESDKVRDHLGTIIRKAIGQEPFLSFSKSGESPIEWTEPLYQFDDQDLPSWPLLAPLKAQRQKCNNCAQIFCSSINLRRHMYEQHIRRRNPNPYEPVYRGNLRKFWDELSLDETKEIVSINNAELKGISGSSIVASLASLVQKQGFSQPKACLKASSDLLGIVQGEFCEQISSGKLFRVLDDASEETFLRRKGESMQKYVFDVGAEEIILEQNAVACASFLVEQKLVKAFNHHEVRKADELANALILQEEADKKSWKDMQNLVKSNKQKKGKSGRREGKAKANTHSSSIVSQPVEDAVGSGSERAELQNVEEGEGDIAPERRNEEEKANDDPSDTHPDENASGSHSGHAESQNVKEGKNVVRKSAKEKENERKYKQKLEKRMAAKSNSGATSVSGSALAESQNIDGCKGDTNPQRHIEEEKADDPLDILPDEDPSRPDFEQAEPQEEKTNVEVKESIVDTPKVQGVPPAKTPISLDESGSDQSHSQDMLQPDQVPTSLEPIKQRDEEMVAEAPSGCTPEHDEPQNVEKTTSLATGSRDIDPNKSNESIVENGDPQVTKQSSRSSNVQECTLEIETRLYGESAVGAKGGEDHTRVGRSSSNISGQGISKAPSISEAKADIELRLNVKLVISPRNQEAAFLSKLGSAKPGL